MKRPRQQHDAGRFPQAVANQQEVITQGEEAAGCAGERPRNRRNTLPSATFAAGPSGAVLNRALVAFLSLGEGKGFAPATKPTTPFNIRTLRF